MDNIWVMRENTYSGMNSFPISIAPYVEWYNQIHGYTYYYVVQNHTYINSASIDTTKQFKKSGNS
jgi:hypothetical protein